MTAELPREPAVSGRGGNGDAAGNVPGAVLGGLSRSAAQQADHGLSDLRGHPDPDRARDRLGRDLAVVAWKRDDGGGGGRGRPAVLRPPPHDPVPTEVPAVVVRLES